MPGLLNAMQDPSLGLLAPQSAQPKFNGIMDFLGSPQAMALASGLLQASGPSRMPVSFGQALGAGMQNMQQQTNSDVDNQYKKALTSQLSNSVLMEQKKQQAMNDMLKQFTAGQQQGLDQKTASQAGMLMMAGQYDKAFDLMNGGKYERPIAVIGADGKQHLIQVSDRGQSREIPGVTPIVKNGTSFSIDPATGQIMFQQGMTDTNLSNLVKDPSKSPPRGGQGGVYVDPTTGQTITTNTPKNQAQDQTTIASMQRVRPQIDSLLKVMPQFQSGATRAQKAVEGFANNYLGTNFALPSQYAEGKAYLAAAPEAMMKAYGLNVTDESLKTMRETIQPFPGESPNGYRSRIESTLVHLKDMEDQAKGRIANGMVVRDANPQQSTQTHQPEVRHYNLKTGRFE